MRRLASEQSEATEDVDQPRDLFAQLPAEATTTWRSPAAADHRVRGIDRLRAWSDGSSLHVGCHGLFCCAVCSPKMYPGARATVVPTWWRSWPNPASRAACSPPSGYLPSRQPSRPLVIHPRPSSPGETRVSTAAANRRSGGMGTSVLAPPTVRGLTLARPWHLRLLRCSRGSSRTDTSEMPRVRACRSAASSTSWVRGASSRPLGHRPPRVGPDRDRPGELAFVELSRGVGEGEAS